MSLQFHCQADEYCLRVSRENESLVLLNRLDEHVFLITLGEESLLVGLAVLVKVIDVVKSERKMLYRHSFVVLVQTLSLL